MTVSSGTLRDLAASAVVEAPGFRPGRREEVLARFWLSDNAAELAVLLADAMDALETISDAWGEGRSAQMASGEPIAFLLARFRELEERAGGAGEGR